MKKLKYQVLLYDELTIYRIIEGEHVLFQSDFEDKKQEIKDKYPDGIIYFEEVDDYERHCRNSSFTFV